MDFLLSYRSIEGSGSSNKVHASYSEEIIINRTPLIKFLLLTVDNRTWKCLIIVGVFLRYIFATYDLGFAKHFKGLTTTGIFNIFLDLLYFVDLLSALTYRCTWPKSSKHLQEDSPYLSRLTWRNYLFRPRRIWMIVIDIISLLPFDLVRYWVPTMLPYHTIAICAPLLRIYRIPVYYLSEFEKVSAHFNSLLHVFVRIGMFWALFVHTFTCLWGYLSRVSEQFQLNWFAQTIRSQGNHGPLDWYSIICYFVQISFTNIGFGDIVPSTDLERALTVLVLILGFIFLYGYVISSLSSVLTEKIRRLTYLRFRLSLMASELESGKVPQAVWKKIQRYYHSLLASRKGIGPVNQLLLSLPDSFITRVYFDIFKPAINASILFRNCDEHSKRAIARAMKIRLYVAGDVVLKRGEFSSKMLYIRKGTIQIMSYQDDETEVMTFGAGTVFGQIAVILSLPTKSEVHAATFCEIHTISRKNLFEVLREYPRAKSTVMNVHRNLLLNLYADKYSIYQANEGIKKEKKSQNALHMHFFYKVPIETSKLARDDICIETKCPYIFMPDTIFLRTWNTMVAIIIVLLSFYYPYEAAFERIYPEHFEPFIVVVDIILICNLYLTLSTAFVRENILFSSKRDVVAARLGGANVWVDIVAILPLHYFLAPDNRLKPVLLCFRCVLFYKVPAKFKELEYASGPTTIFILRLVKYVLYFILGAYVMGLIYYMQACYFDFCHPQSWYEVFAYITSVVEPIWVCLYFATLTMTGTGFGDITVGDIQDIFYVQGFTVFGVLLYIYLIADYSGYLSLDGTPRQNFIQLAERVNSYLLGQKMLGSERSRVRQFLNLQWERNKGHEFTSDENLFYDTPSHLLYEASQFTRSRGIFKMEIFKGLGKEIIGSVLSNSFRKVFPPHEVVIYAGDVCDFLMIIEEGYCEVTYGKDLSVTKLLRAGQDICTIELMLGLTALCHVRTLTHCVIMKVSKDSMNRAFALNPIAARELEESISEFKNSPLLKDVQKSRPIPLHLNVRTTVEKSFYRFLYYRKQSGNKELRDPYLRLGICQWMRYFLRSTTVLPYGTFLKRWDFSRCVFAFLSGILFPCIPYFQLEYPFLFYVGVMLDISALIDIYFRFHVCYYNDQNLLVSHPLWTCSHYLKGSFVLDFTFCFPFDRVMYRQIYDSKGETLVSNHSADVLRMFRVGQIYRIFAKLNAIGQDFLSTSRLFWVLITTAALATVFINLLTSILILMCMNYKVNKNGRYRIVYLRNTQKHFETLFRKYDFPTQPSYIFILNFYWTASVAFGVGFGDITANTRELMIYVVVVIVTSYLYFQYITILIASYLTGINMNLTLFQKRMSHLVSYLKAENVEPLLRKHIINHFEYIWKKNKAMQAQYVFQNFSVALRDDVMYHLYEETVKGVAAFADLDPSFHRILSSKLDEIHFQSGAAIYKPGDIISQLFIVHQGEVTLVGKDENETSELGRSKVFGLLQNVPQDMMTLSAVATKNVTVLGVNATELFEILADVERGLVDQSLAQQQNLKLTEALMKSNTTKTEFEEDYANIITSGSKNSVIFLIQRFSKPIQFFYVVLSLFSANVSTYCLAFQFGNVYISILTVLSELLFILQIFLKFHHGYVDEFGEFVSDLRLIKARYIRTTGFYIDFICVVPIEIFALLAEPENTFYAITWLRMTKLLRLYNVWYFFNMKFDTLNVNMVLLKISAVGIWTGTLLHQCSCIWFLISCPKTICTNSITWNNFKMHGAELYYLNSLYFVISVLTTTGFGDVTPHNSLEILYVTALLFISFFYTAIFIGEMVSTSRKYILTKSNYEFEVQGLKNYLHANDVSHDTQKAVSEYLENLWRNERGLQIPVLLNNAPRYLTYEIKLSTYGHHINHNSLFEHCSPNFRKQLIDLLYRTLFYPGNIITFEGEVNRTAYFVHSGQVRCHSASVKPPKKIYVENTSFGLTQCIIQNLPHTSTYFAITACVILSLNISKCEYLNKFFPEDMKTVTEKVKILQEKEFTINNNEQQ